MDTQATNFKVIGLTSMPINSIYEEKDDISPVISYEGEGEHTLSYKVVDYFGKVIASESVTVSGIGSYTVSFEEKPKRGFYVVYTEIDGVSTGREDLFSVVISADERKYYDSFIGLDIASFDIISKFVDDYARAAHLAGVTYVRERHFECMEHDSARKYSFERLDRTINAYSKYGIRVLPLNHSTPSWARSSNHRIVDDIRTKYDYYKTIAQRYGNKADWEIWNEPELDQMTAGPKTADNMAALFKAEAIALHDSGVECRTVMPGMASAPAEYLEHLMQNDISRFVDTYSYHGHRIVWGSDANDMRDMTPPSSWGRHAINYSKLGMDNLYFCNTEAGLATEMLDGKDYIEVERQKAQARYLPTSMIQGAALGEDKHIYFLFPAYREGILQWGMFTYSHTPYASYSSLSTLTHVLGEGRYINSIPSLPAGVHGEVFADGEYRVAAFWSDEEREITVKTDAQSGVHVTIVGAESTIESDNGVFTLKVSPDIIYLKIKGNFIGATERKYPAKQITPHKLTRAERVVIELIFPEEICERAKYTGYRLSEDKETVIRARVTNFNSEPISGRIVGEVYGGWKLKENSKEIVLDAMGQKDVEFTVFSSGNVTPELKTPAVFIGEFEGEMSSRTVSYIISEREGEVTSRPIIGAMDPDNWDRNVQKGSELTIEKLDDETMEISCTFDHYNKWLYPRMYLQDGDSFEGTKGMLFDFYIDDVERMPVLRNWAHENNGCAYYLEQKIINLHPGWNRVKIPWTMLNISEFSQADDNFTLDDYEICRISIGVNSYTPSIKYKLRNISVYSYPSDNVFSRVELHKPTVQNDGEKVIVDADIIVNETGILEETLSVRAGRDEMPFCYKDGKVHSEFSLPKGQHDLSVQFVDRCGDIVQGIFSLAIGS